MDLGVRLWIKMRKTGVMYGLCIGYIQADGNVRGKVRDRPRWIPEVSTSGWSIYMEHI